MIRTARLLASAVSAAALLLAVPHAAGASVSHDARPAVSVSPVVSVPSFAPVRGARSVLVRLGDNGIAFAIRTRDLDPGTTATLLLVVFNSPAGCSHGAAGARCGEGDVVPGGAAQASVLVVTQRAIGRAGQLTAAGRLAPNDTTDAVFGPGLTNSAGADIHLVVQHDATIVQASIHESR